MITQLAHAGHTHEATAAAAKHFLSDWYVALPLFLLALALFAGLVHLIFRKAIVTITLVDVALLIVGFTAYQVSAVVSVLSITLGLAGTLFLTLTSLGPAPKPVKGRH